MRGLSRAANWTVGVPETLRSPAAVCRIALRCPGARAVRGPRLRRIASRCIGRSAAVNRSVRGRWSVVREFTLACGHDRIVVGRCPRTIGRRRCAGSSAARVDGAIRRAIHGIVRSSIQVAVRLRIPGAGSRQPSCIHRVDGRVGSSCCRCSARHNCTVLYGRGRRGDTPPCVCSAEGALPGG